METLYQGGVLLCANGDPTHYIMVTKPHLGTAYNELCIPGHILATKASKRALRGVVFVSTTRVHVRHLLPLPTTSLCALQSYDVLICWPWLK